MAKDEVPGVTPDVLTDTEQSEGFDLEEAQSNLEDALKAARAVVSALECAESCETVDDYRANLLDARENASELKTELAAL